MSIDSISNLEGGLSVRNKLNEAIQQANAAAAHIGRTDNPHGVTKSQVGLAQVDNVSASALRARSTHTGTQPLSSISDAGTAASRDVDAFEPAGAAEQAAQAAQDYAVQRSNHTGTQPISSVSGLQSALDDLNPQNNLDAGGPPGASDDETAGYSELSLWVYDGTVYRCIDATAGAAVWVETGISVEDLGSAALAEVEDFDPAGSAQAAEENAAEYTDDAVAPLSRAQALRDLRDAATLDLDFASGDYTVDTGEKLRTTNAGEMLTVERATPKWVFGPNGKLREVPPNTLARQWNPETGEPKGVLIEESRTNFLLWGEDVTQEPWAVGGDLHAEPYSDPRGLTHSMLYTVGNNVYSSLRQTAGIPDGDGLTYTFSLVLKLFGHPDVRDIRLGDSRNSNTPRRWYAEIDSASGAIVRETNTTNTKHVDLGGGYHKYVMTYVNDETKSNSINMTFSSNSVDRVDIAAIGTIQFEQGTQSSSYIPTEDAPATRAADNVSRVLGEEFNRGGSTIVARARFDGPLPDSSAFFDRRNVISLSGSILSHRLYLIAGGLYLQMRRADGSFTSASALSLARPIIPGELYTVAISTKSGETRIALDGAVSSPVETELDFSGDVTLILGSSNTEGELRGSLLETLYLPHTSTEAELVELTS